jgi:hypothetical protein
MSDPEQDSQDPLTYGITHKLRETQDDEYSIIYRHHNVEYNYTTGFNEFHVCGMKVSGDHGSTSDYELWVEKSLGDFKEIDIPHLPDGYWIATMDPRNQREAIIRCPIFKETDSAYLIHCKFSDPGWCGSPIFRVDQDVISFIGVIGEVLTWTEPILIVRKMVRPIISLKVLNFIIENPDFTHLKAGVGVGKTTGVPLALALVTNQSVVCTQPTRAGVNTAKFLMARYPQAPIGLMTGTSVKNPSAQVMYATPFYVATGKLVRDHTIVDEFHVQDEFSQAIPELDPQARVMTATPHDDDGRYKVIPGSTPWQNLHGDQVLRMKGMFRVGSILNKLVDIIPKYFGLGIVVLKLPSYKDIDEAMDWFDRTFPRLACARWTGTDTPVTLDGVNVLCCTDVIETGITISRIACAIDSGVCTAVYPDPLFGRLNISKMRCRPESVDQFKGRVRRTRNGDHILFDWYQMPFKPAPKSLLKEMVKDHPNPEIVAKFGTITQPTTLGKAYLAGYDPVFASYNMYEVQGAPAMPERAAIRAPRSSGIIALPEIPLNFPPESGLRECQLADYCPASRLMSRQQPRVVRVLLRALATTTFQDGDELTYGELITEGAKAVLEDIKPVGNKWVDDPGKVIFSYIRSFFKNVTSREAWNNILAFIMGILKRIDGAFRVAIPRAAAMLTVITYRVGGFVFSVTVEGLRLIQDRTLEMWERRYKMISQEPIIIPDSWEGLQAQVYRMVAGEEPTVQKIFVGRAVINVACLAARQAIQDWEVEWYKALLDKHGSEVEKIFPHRKIRFYFYRVSGLFLNLISVMLNPDVTTFAVGYNTMLGAYCDWTTAWWRAQVENELKLVVKVVGRKSDDEIDKSQLVDPNSVRFNIWSYAGAFMPAIFGMTDVSFVTVPPTSGKQFIARVVLEDILNTVLSLPTHIDMFKALTQNVPWLGSWGSFLKQVKDACGGVLQFFRGTSKAAVDISKRLIGLSRGTHSDTYAVPAPGRVPSPSPITVNPKPRLVTAVRYRPTMLEHLTSGDDDVDCPLSPTTSDTSSRHATAPTRQPGGRHRVRGTQ